jgi:hypothetical protein
VLAHLVDDGYESNEVFKNSFYNIFEYLVDWGKIRFHHNTYGIHKTIIQLL